MTYLNQDIVTTEEVDCAGRKLTPGTEFRLKGDKRTIYVFIKYATNTKLGTSWVDAAEKSGGFKSVRLDDIILPKEKTKLVKRTKQSRPRRSS